jgi:hypothetical protein
MDSAKGPVRGVSVPAMPAASLIDPLSMAGNTFSITMLWYVVVVSPDVE